MITNNDISLIKGMLQRGDFQSDIAAYFGINSGRISEINTGKKGANIIAALASDLPPPGPYEIAGRSAMKTKETLIALRDLINETLQEVEQWNSLEN